MAAGGAASAGLAPVLYHMSDDEEDMAFRARDDEPKTPTSPRPYDDDMGSPIYSSPEPDEHMPRSPAYSSVAAVPPPHYEVYDGGDAPASSTCSWNSINDDRPWSPSSELPLPDYDEPEPDEAGAERQGRSLAEDALYHYNADPSNKVKYELVEAGPNSCFLIGRGKLYGHVNFVARPSTESLPERFFFAELYHQVGRERCIPTCLCSLDSEDERVGGVADDPIAERSPWNVSVDYCISCGDDLKHPKDGTCYKAGHFYTLP